mgnify:CR=1 FL=1
MDRLVHVVLISFKPETPEETKQWIYQKYQTLEQDCGSKDAGILYWRVQENLDLRKGVHLVEVAVYTDNDALQAFRNHPKHKEITDVLRDVADWQVGDITCPFPL